MNKKSVNYVLITAIVIGVLIFTNFFNGEKQQFQQQTVVTEFDDGEKSYVDDTHLILQSFEQQKNDIQVRASGTIKAILPDDNKGSRHQRFILELSNGSTILIAHNIDLAPRIPNIEKGDQVEFYGVYEYNPQGGVIHWTHHDPRGKHIGGWLKHNGKKYE